MAPYAGIARRTPVYLTLDLRSVEDPGIHQLGGFPTIWADDLVSFLVLTEFSGPRLRLPSAYRRIPSPSLFLPHSVPVLSGPLPP